MIVHANRKTYEVIEDTFANYPKHVEGNKVFVIDENVYDLHSDVNETTVMQKYLTIDPTEHIKNLSGVQKVLDFFIENNVNRSTTVIAVGGGIIQDLVSFATSIYYRGISWVFYPTTLLAQADSCIGSKNCLNYEYKNDSIKNTLGTFNPPDKVIIDYNFLSTLSDIDYRSGVGEIIKVHLMESRVISEILRNDLDKILTREDIISEYIKRSLNYKQIYIEKDEFDKDYRNLLNYGHCFGHAIEAASSYRLSHGMAVTLGMDIVNRYSKKVGYLPQEDYDLMHETITKNLVLVPQLEIPDFNYIFKFLKNDKKNVGVSIIMILTKGFGKMVKEPITKKILEECWNEFKAEHI